jgi:hypothetical protein
LAISGPALRISGNPLGDSAQKLRDQSIAFFAFRIAGQQVLNPSALGDLLFCFTKMLLGKIVIQAFIPEILNG